MLKTGYPTCGALGGSRECNSLSQRSALLTCEVKNRGTPLAGLQVGQGSVTPCRKDQLCQSAKLEIEGFSRGLGVVKGEAKVLLSFVASQTMIYIVFAVTLLICQKSAFYFYLLLAWQQVATKVTNTKAPQAGYPIYPPKIFLANLKFY